MRSMFVEWAWVLVLGALMSTLLVATKATGRLDNVVYDALVRLDPRPASDDVIIVSIDDQSLRQVGAWPWARSSHAELIDRLAAAHPAAIAYDVLFLEASPDPASDTALAASVARAGRVCLPLLLERPGYDGSGVRVTLPLPALAAAAQLGHAAVVYDPDGVARRALLFENAGGRRVPHLMECARRLGQGAASPLPTPTAEPLAPYARPGAFRAVPAASVLNGETPAAFFTGKYVLVGVTASGMDNSYSTPLSTGGGAMSGVELDANLLNDLLSHRLTRVAPPGLQLAYTLAGVLAVMAALALLPPRRAMPLGFGVLLLALAASALGLFAAQIWLPPFALILTIVVIFPLWGWRRLEAASGYMMSELQRFAGEPEVLPLIAWPRSGGDLVARQIQLMDQTIRRARDLRRFASDTLRHLPDPTLVVGRRGRVLFANAHAEAMDATVGASLPRLAAGWTTLAGERLAMPSPQAMGENWTAEAMSPDGRIHLAAAAPYIDSAGELGAWIVRLTDITALKAAEAQREEFIQFLTHDMRSPQSSILALLDTAPPGAVPADLAGKLAGYARRTLALAGNFVQLARAGSAPLEFETLDLNDVATEAVDDLYPQARRAKMRLELAAPDEELLIAGERALLTRAVMNIIENAIKYSPPETSVVCRLWRENGRAMLAISDQGRGMTPEQRSTLFTRFQRFAARDRRTVEGAGLGLALVWEVIRRHGGTIACEGALDQGTTFTLSFPLVAA
jgi:CHASE2 domain-containing sensor protein/signal transduction histidine kinase